MGAKTFCNNTEYELAITLTIRHGDTPGSEAGSKAFTLGAHGNTFITYSEGINPYLDKILVSANGQGNHIEVQLGVVTRGSSVDNAFNMHDTVDINKSNDSLVLSFRNK